MSYPDEENREFGVRPYSENLDAIIDKEVSSLIFSSYKKTEEVLKANMDKLKLVSIHNNCTFCSFSKLQEGRPLALPLFWGWLGWCRYDTCL